MSAYLCRCCGAALDVKKGTKVCECGYCGITQTVPRLDLDEKAILWERADALRRSGEFDRAAALYEQLAELDPTDPDVFWSLTLCRFGVEYVEEPNSHKRIPTINRVQYSPLIEDRDYRRAAELADGDQRRVYIIQARQLEELRLNVLEVSRTERPYDIFICYKETDASGRRTEDSLLAAQLYRSFTAEGLRVFYARVTLEDKAGAAYEPYIFAAINSAKIMLALGTNPDNFNAVWVKNEWSRYLTRIAETSRGVLAVLYKDMPPEHLPKEFAHLQTFDMSAPDFMNDLLRGVRKVLSAEDTAEAETEPADEPANAAGSESASPAALLRRAELALEDGEYSEANSFCERVLDIEPENPSAYLIKLLAQYRVGSVERLYELRADISYSGNYKKLMRFADEETRARLTECRERTTYGILRGGFENARTAEECFAAAEGFKSLSGYKDSDEMAERCLKTAEKLRQEEAVYKLEREYREAKAALEGGDPEGLAEARKSFEALGDYENSAALAEECAERLNELAEEKRRREEEEEKAEREERRRRERSRRIALRTSLIGAAVVAAATAAVLIGRGIYFSVRYDRALALRDRGDFDGAAAAFAEISDYSDSAERIKETRYLKAQSLMESGDYAEAEERFRQLGVYSDATRMANEARYRRALSLAESDTELAVKLLESLGSYSDSAEKALETRYKHAERLCGEKRFGEAAELFGELGSYSDAAERAVSATYSRGEHALELGEYAEAAAAFESLGGYSDCAERTAEAKYLLAEQCYLNGSFSEAAELYDKLRSCYTSEERQSELNFKAGRAYLNAGDSGMAMKLLYGSTIEGAAELYDRARYERALECADNGEYIRALELLAENPDYKDSAEKTTEITYLRALELLENKRYDAAGDVLNELGDYKNSRELLEDIPILRLFNADAGDVISFGKYKQDIWGAEEDIQWQVLDREGDRILVVSERLLDYLPFGGEEWADSSLRAWLNEEFYDASFGAEQKERIILPNLTAEGADSRDTEDKIFLLSAADTFNYFSDIEARQARYSAWAADKYSDFTKAAYSTSESRRWWVRDTSYQPDKIKAIGDDGVLGSIDHTEAAGVRPAMWIDVSRG